MLTITGLYLVAGLIEKTTGATDTREMGGLYAAGAPLGVAFLILVLAVAGVPPFLGFWPKLLLLESSLDNMRVVTGGPIDWWAAALAMSLLANALLTLIAGTRIWAHVFWRAGPEGALSEVPNERLRPLKRGEQWLGFGSTAALVGVVVLLGLLPNRLLDLGRSAAIDLLRPDAYIAATNLAGSVP
jgi:multicomponent Na+:H+ antiporter subunit D